MNLGIVHNNAFENSHHKNCYINILFPLYLLHRVDHGIDISQFV